MVRDVIDVERAFRFLRGLKRNNDRAWFSEHRADYDEHVKPEWLDLVTGLLADAVSFDERFAYVDPKACLFRLHRDTRFASDKTPYKTAITAWLSPRGKGGWTPGFYLHLEPGNTFVAAGLYVPTKEDLDVLRRHFAEADLRAFERLLKAKSFAPYLPLETEPLTRSPRGFPKEHPHLDLIRARRYIVRRAFPDADVRTRGAYRTFRDAMRDTAPLVNYLAALVSSDEMREPIDG